MPVTVRPCLKTLQRYAPLAALGLLAVACHAASASVIASDSFESYTPGALDDQGPAANGWGEAWTAVAGTNIVNKSLSYHNASISIDGGAKAVQLATPDNTSAISRPFTGQTGTVYFSFLFRTETTPTNGDFVHFMLNNDTDNDNSAGIGDIDTGAPTFGARIGNSNGGTSANASTHYLANTTYFLVGKMEDDPANTGDSPDEFNRITVWVNPTTFNESAPGTTWSVSDKATDGTFSAVDTFTVRTFNLSSGDVYYFDALSIGDSFAAVVPEPASLALATLCAPALLRRRRS